MELKRKKIKYYAVFRGTRLGMYTLWEECSACVLGFSGCLFRSFSTMEEAVEAWDVYFELNSDNDKSSIKEVISNMNLQEFGMFEKKKSDIWMSMKNGSIWIKSLYGWNFCYIFILLLFFFIGVIVGIQSW